MKSIKLAPIINSLNIDYQPGKSLTLRVSKTEQEKRKRFRFWLVILLIVVTALLVAIRYTSMLSFDNQGVLLIIVFGLLIGYSIFRSTQNYIKVPYTFQKIVFLPTSIQVDEEATIKIQSPVAYDLILNQKAIRPFIKMKLSTGELISFHLDSMQDFPVITDAIADILKSKFESHQVIDESTEKLTFRNSL